MIEKIDFARVSTKLKVVIGPDGNIIYHKVISPDFRSFNKNDLINPINSFKKFTVNSCIEQVFLSGGELKIWVDSSRKNILGVETEGC